MRLSFLTRRSRVPLFLALFGVLGILFLVPTQSASAAPGDDEDPKNLAAKLTTVSRNYVANKQKLTVSRKRQTTLAAELASAEASLKGVSKEVDKIARMAFVDGNLTLLYAALSGEPSGVFVAKLTTLDQIAQKQAAVINKAKAARAEIAAKKKATDEEVAKFAAAEKALAKSKADIEKALEEVGGLPADDPALRAGAASAVPAPRNSDGSWPDESCSQDDPTTGGCLTPRTLHAYYQARAAGFKRYAACWRESNGDHGAGRACDLAAYTGGFEDHDATGDDKAYGSNLATFFVVNAERLGLNYVIWYRRIWQVGVGWRTYNCSGGAAACHTNHVHISVY